MTGTRNGDAGERGEGALARWSRVKSETRATPPALRDGESGDVTEAAETAGPELDAAESPNAIESAEAEPVRLEDLPDIETLTYESDFTQFMREGVPEELRRLALRKLWSSDPVLANVDGLNDYDLDYNKLGVDTRVAAALLEDREQREKALRDGGRSGRPRDTAPPDAARSEAEPDGAEPDGAVPETPELAEAAESEPEEGETEAAAAAEDRAEKPA